MAQEIAHVVACHAGRGKPLTFLRFSGSFESEVNFLGLQYMYKAGYDLQAFTTFFETVEVMEKKKPGPWPGAKIVRRLQTRVAGNDRESQTLFPAEPQYKLDTTEFENVKPSLAALENQHGINGAKASEPTLRRTPRPTDVAAATTKMNVRP